MIPRPAAPWYLHPAEEAASWELLVRGCGLAFAVINVHNGPGKALDGYYAAALEQGCGTPLAGYVDVAYGARSVGQTLRQAEAWRRWYGVRSVMLDQVPSVPRQGGWSVDVVDALRNAGCERVLLNPGTVPHPDLVEAADVTCTFEGSWRDYSRARPAASDAADRCRTWHLVHSCPPQSQSRALELASARGVGHAWVTAGILPDPWSHPQERW